MVEARSELQVFTQGLRITTFRYVPPDLVPGSQEVEQYLNALNTQILTRLQKGGEAFLSNAVIGETFVLRACIVNFRTSLEDIEALPAIIIRMGRETDVAIRPAHRQEAIEEEEYENRLFSLSRNLDCKQALVLWAGTTVV